MLVMRNVLAIAVYTRGRVQAQRNSKIVFERIEQIQIEQLICRPPQGPCTCCLPVNIRFNFKGVHPPVRNILPMKRPCHKNRPVIANELIVWRLFSMTCSYLCLGIGNEGWDMIKRLLFLIFLFIFLFYIYNVDKLRLSSFVFFVTLDLSRV